MTGSILLFAAGLALLLLGAHWMVGASIDAARRLSVPSLVVGLTLVAWGTSAPELALNLVAALKGRGDLALGNVVGANICNMSLVIGTCALMRPLLVGERLVRIELWLNAAIVGGLALAGLFDLLAAPTAALLLGVFGAYSAWTVMASLRAGGAAEEPGDGPPPRGWVGIAIGFVAGLVLLSVGGSFASDGASGFALALGVPAALVGVTVVSIGTTLPELVTSVTAVRRGQTDLATGNAIGSCLFNAGAIYGITGVLAPPEVGRGLDLPFAFMGVLTLMVIVVSRTGGRSVSRLEGGMLLSAYGLFLLLSARAALAPEG